MTSGTATFVIATRGSALAMAQAHEVAHRCAELCASAEFKVQVIKTTGDKLQDVSLQASNLPKGLFTKELEVALLTHEADMAVHSLKDLPTQLPEGLQLGAVLPREDVRDVLIYRGAERGGVPTHAGRGFPAATGLHGLPRGAVIATSSVRRSAQLLETRPDLSLVPIRGNVPTRLRKLAQQPELDALVLAAAGLARLKIIVSADGALRQTAPFLSENVAIPEGLQAEFLPLGLMLPCVGQGAIGIETRVGDQRLAQLCLKVNDFSAFRCVAAERAFLHAMGGGCQLAVAAHATFDNELVHLRAVSYLGKSPRRGAVHGRPAEAEALGEALARELKP